MHTFLVQIIFEFIIKTILLLSVDIIKASRVVYVVVFINRISKYEILSSLCCGIIGKCIYDI